MATSAGNGGSGQQLPAVREAARLVCEQSKDDISPTARAIVGGMDGATDRFAAGIVLAAGGEKGERTEGASEKKPAGVLSKEGPDGEKGGSSEPRVSGQRLENGPNEPRDSGPNGAAPKLSSKRSVTFASENDGADVEGRATTPCDKEATSCATGEDEGPDAVAAGGAGGGTVGDAGGRAAAQEAVCAAAPVSVSQATLGGRSMSGGGSVSEGSDSARLAGGPVGENVAASSRDSPGGGAANELPVADSQATLGGRTMSGSGGAASESEAGRSASSASTHNALIVQPVSQSQATLAGFAELSGGNTSATQVPTAEVPTAAAQEKEDELSSVMSLSPSESLIDKIHMKECLSSEDDHPVLGNPGDCKLFQRKGSTRVAFKIGKSGREYREAPLGNYRKNKSSLTGEYIDLREQMKQAAAKSSTESSQTRQNGTREAGQEDEVSSVMSLSPSDSLIDKIHMKECLSSDDDEAPAGKLGGGRQVMRKDSAKVIFKVGKSGREYREAALGNYRKSKSALTGEYIDLRAQMKEAAAAATRAGVSDHLLGGLCDGAAEAGVGSRESARKGNMRESSSHTNASGKKLKRLDSGVNPGRRSSDAHEAGEEEEATPRDGGRTRVHKKKATQRSASNLESKEEEDPRSPSSLSDGSASEGSASAGSVQDITYLGNIEELFDQFLTDRTGAVGAASEFGSTADFDDLQRESAEVRRDARRSSVNPYKSSKEQRRASSANSGSYSAASEQRRARRRRLRTLKKRVDEWLRCDPDVLEKCLGNGPHKGRYPINYLYLLGTEDSIGFAEDLILRYFGFGTWSLFLSDFCSELAVPRQWKCWNTRVSFLVRSSSI